MNPRMNLRATFLLFALILIPPGISHAKAISPRERVIAEVTRLGGKLEFDETRTDKAIVKVDLHATQVTDSDLAFLQTSKNGLKELRYLDLRLTKIGDEGVARLKRSK